MTKDYAIIGKNVHFHRLSKIVYKRSWLLRSAFSSFIQISRLFLSVGYAVLKKTAWLTGTGRRSNSAGRTKFQRLVSTDTDADVQRRDGWVPADCHSQSASHDQAASSSAPSHPHSAPSATNSTKSRLYH